MVREARARQSPAISTPDPPARAEAVGLAVLCVGVLLYWAFQYHPFLLPNNDYYSFERVARSFAEGSLPSSFKRMPIFPAAMAALEPLLPGRHSWLDAALVWNQLFSVATLVVLFWLARGCFGRGALLVPLLFATTTQFHAMGLQPLVEPSLGLFVVLAFEGLRRGRLWQYAAAGAAALSRYEAGMLIPVLFLANTWRAERRGLHLALAALAASGCVVWAALGLLAGSGGGFYLELMEGMGWQPAPAFLLRSLQEPFEGWYVARWAWLPVAVVVVGGPVAAGLRLGVRRFPREALTMAGFWALCVLTIVAFGVNKARYVYATQWIPLFFWAAGAVWLGRAGARALAARRERLPLPLLGAGAGALAALALALWLARLARQEHVVPLALDLAGLAGALALAAVAVRSALSAVEAGPARRVAGLALALALVPLVAGGLSGKLHALYKIHHANHSAWLLAGWLEENLRDDDRVVLLPRSHVQHLTGLDAARMELFSSMPAETPAELARVMRARGLTLVAYTDRGDVDDPAEAYYHRIKNADLADHFAGGGPVPGFDLVATIPLPEGLGRRPVQVYRLRTGPAGEPARSEVTAG